MNIFDIVFIKIAAAIVFTLLIGIIFGIVFLATIITKEEIKGRLKNKK